MSGVLPPLRELGMALRSRELTSTEHVQDVLKRLAADTSNAVVTLDPDRALAAAAALDDELARGGWRGPLHGVAVGVKDLIDVAGLPTRAGSNVLAAAPPAEADAPVVTRLREAGAVIVAKLHTHEFAYGPTGDVSATGPARNPHDPSRITGGSSSGPAAAVAAGHLPLALGTDTGASVRTPAALCGVVGLKPAFGALPTDGCFPLSETLDHVGVLAPDVHAASIAWDVLSRPDGTGGGIQAPGVSGVRVGLLVDEYWRPLDPALAAAVDDAAARLRAGGAQVHEVRTPMIDDLAATYPLIVGAEAYATHARWLAERPQDYQPITRDRLLPFADQSARTYVDALRTRRRLTAALRAAVDHVDVLLLPTTRLRATPIGADEVEAGGVTVAVRPQLLGLTLPFNLTGWPAVSVPGEVPDGGLPAGVQVVGVRLEERGVLRVAAAIEQR
jgi:Asp-tRNA(Asn)/Glu-tRNA(Gln) amidotransferase A subunit family amidase